MIILNSALGFGLHKSSWLPLVLPWYIICSGRNSPDKEITSVKVIFRLSVKPLIGTDWELQL